MCEIGVAGGARSEIIRHELSLSSSLLGRRRRARSSREGEEVRRNAQWKREVAEPSAWRWVRRLRRARGRSRSRIRRRNAGWRDGGSERRGFASVVGGEDGERW